ncbi:amino acid/amide ABC transporter membrane protein 2, HAAT family [Paracoccus alcaliphilus]|uniref:Amino acid/amide ABC transporter membrane protein 2, HAAT family n=1 Tax=Paracoccus alcaliphilus TaxID=34002 RepID=A0A1H8NDF4_9RHOB|nr:branched-chain amino acid ABC transporter permease [Paracoccus alcaliphilus]WCR18610.1 branched-chain amino acid ABC transporter permease [Paracoccus alcaliphilus]SEO27518.1 amino acid/amide ABC transporter membrane protein 2, HAAT family [Paracoccus alcaliphilus]
MIRALHLITGLCLLTAPLLLSDFWLMNILGRTLVYGIIALSLTFLATYGGFVSLAQTMIAGVAGYTIAITVPEAVPANGAQLPYAVAIPLALLAATLAGLLVGMISMRTNDIYLLMITLALAVGGSLFAQANTALLNGYEGIRNVLGPEVLGLPLRDPLVFYLTALAIAAMLYLAVLWLVKTPFGLVLQGLRSHPRRVSALGFDAGLHRVMAFAVAGFIAGVGGIMVTIYNIGITPASIGMGATVNILVMCVIGGMRHPAGAFIGALIFTLLDTFAASIYDRDRFNTLIGMVFLGIVLLSPDGVPGLIQSARRQMRKLYRGVEERPGNQG